MVVLKWQGKKKREFRLADGGISATIHLSPGSIISVSESTWEELEKKVKLELLNKEIVVTKDTTTKDNVKYNKKKYKRYNRENAK